MVSCTQFGEQYLKWVNGLTIFVSIVVLAIGVYAVVENEFSTTIPGFALDFSRFAGIGILVFGLLILLLSILGCKTAKADNKFFVIVYNLLMTVFWLILLVAGVLLLVYAGVFDEVSLGNSDQLEDAVKVQINDAQLALYEGCCVQGYPNATLTAIPSCASNPCEEDSKDLCTCYQDTVVFNDYLTKIFQDEVCEFAEKITVKGKNLIGNPASDGMCGGGDPKKFQENVAYLVKNYALGISIGVLILSVILFFALVFGCVIFFNVDAERKRKEANKEAGDLTGTAPAGNTAAQYV